MWATMKSPIYLATIVILAGLCLPLASPATHAQGSETLQAPSDILNSPASLPDLTPETIDPYAEKPMDMPTFEDDQSTIAPNAATPALEPWQQEKRKTYNGQTADDIFWTLPKDVQDQILAETYDVHNQCKKYELYMKFHDCDCLGSRFFDERVFTPEATRDQISNKITSDCVSTASIAGYAYEECVSRSIRMLNVDKLDEFCTCYSNMYADEYKLSPYPDYTNLRQVGIRSNRACFKKVPGALRDNDPNNPYR